MNRARAGIRHAGRANPSPRPARPRTGCRNLSPRCCDGRRNHSQAGAVTSRQLEGRAALPLVDHGRRGCSAESGRLGAAKWGGRERSPRARGSDVTSSTRGTAAGHARRRVDCSAGCSNCERSKHVEHAWRGKKTDEVGVPRREAGRRAVAHTHTQGSGARTIAIANANFSEWRQTSARAMRRREMRNKDFCKGS